MMNRVSDFASALGSSLKSMVKIALQSRPVIKPVAARGHKVVILANGPSLRGTIDDHQLLLKALPTIAVNFMANAPEFKVLKPDYYVLADPHFFHATADVNVAKLWASLAAVDWNMCLCVPVREAAAVRRLLGPDTKIRVSTFNFVGAEGFGWFERLAYKHHFAMPRPRNVLIPAIMVAIAAGFTEIYLTGADHSWMETLRVNDNNELISVQPHFYKDSKEETARSTAEYRGYHLHDILQSFYVAFSSYHRLQRFALRAGIHIYNATPGSFIDAFPRSELNA